MRFLFGSVEGLVDVLARDRALKSPFAIVLANVGTCEAFRRACRDRFGREPSERGRFRASDDCEWIVTTPTAAAFRTAASCAIEDGATAASAELDDQKIVGCAAILRVHLTTADELPKPPSISDGISRALRTCTCYGSLAFFALFLIAIVWETWS